MKNTEKHSWRGFKGDNWRTEIDVRGFIMENYSPYLGGGEFLRGPSERTEKLNEKYLKLADEERKRGGVLDVDVKSVSSLLSYGAGYLDKENEIIVGFQTDSPLKRGINPFGGIRMAEQACEAYGYKLSDEVKDHFKYRTTHNDGVFRVYTDEMKAARRSGVITGLPDAYGRGRIIGDYRRVALYGADFLIKCKKADMAALGDGKMGAENIQLREEVFRQIDFLQKLKDMALLYGINISGPAADAREAAQWVYFAYLAAIKEQNGAAMSLGRVGTFLDIFFERDLNEGVFGERGAQEIIDQFVLKLRMARQLRTPEYNELFAGDPTWVTESVGGMALDGRTLVTKNSFRFLHTLRNLKPAPEPNLTVLWSAELPEPFKRFCAEISIDTDGIQYESDDLMRPLYGDDYAIACCVSAMKIGKEMQFFGARCNLPKVLLLSLNGGRDEVSGELIADLKDGADTLQTIGSEPCKSPHPAPSREPALAPLPRRGIGVSVSQADCAKDITVGRDEDVAPCGGVNCGINASKTPNSFVQLAQKASNLFVQSAQKTEGICGENGVNPSVPLAYEKIKEDFSHNNDGVLDYKTVRKNFSRYMDWLCGLYVSTMNVIHFMHDKYAYEKIQMALHDTFVHRYMAFGISGLSVAADSLSAIKYAKVTPIRDNRGIITGFNVDGDFPKFGNDDRRVDSLAKSVVKEFIRKLKKHKAYRGAEHTLSLLTITSNVVYGKKTGATPDGRLSGAPFAPGANPMHGREERGALASLNSVASLQFCDCRDGISNTFSVTPSTLGKGRENQIGNLVSVLEGYFKHGAHHLNVNVLDREKLLDAMDNPDKYPLLSLRVSGYAVRFNSLSREQQEEVIARTFF